MHHGKFAIIKKNIARKKYVHYKKINNHGFGILSILIFIGTIALIAGILVTAYNRTLTDEDSASRIDSEQYGETKCLTQDEIEVCSRVVDTSPSYMDGYILETEYVNTSEQTFTYTYPSGCTSPVKMIDGENASTAIQTCTWALVDVSIAPGAKKSYESEFTAAMLDGEKRTIQISWAGIESPEIEVAKLEPTEDEKETIRELCREVEHSLEHPTPPVCRLIPIMVVDADQFTPTSLKQHMREKHNLNARYRERPASLPETDTPFEPVFSVYIPLFDVEQYEQHRQEIQDDPLLELLAHENIPLPR